MKRIAVLMVVLACACSKSKDQPAAGSGAASGDMAGSGSAMAGSGSAMAGIGSAMTGSDTGSGSAMAGSGSATAGSGSAMAGSGSDTGAGSGSAAAGSGASSDFDFDKLTHQQRMDFMKTKVMPEMKTAFQGHDAKAFAKFTCKTCHGKDPQKSKFKMPNPELPKLDFVALKAGKQKPKMAEFMGKGVTPQMAKLLNLPEHSEANPKGFGCLGCHLQKK
jgi:hypothetical protein